MDEEHSFPDEVTRVPTREDLANICRALNEKGARYIIVGGAAMIESGLLRTTHDVDLLIDSSEQNVSVVCDALAILPDGASREVRPSDVADYIVVRINDEFTIDLMGSACGMTYNDSTSLIEWKELNGVRIPFASPMLLWKTKQTHREKDALDRAFLRKWFEDRGMGIPE